MGKEALLFSPLYPLEIVPLAARRDRLPQRLFSARFNRPGRGSIPATWSGGRVVGRVNGTDGRLKSLLPYAFWPPYAIHGGTDTSWAAVSARAAHSGRAGRPPRAGRWPRSSPATAATPPPGWLPSAAARRHSTS